ncbi:arachidonate 15-lipoxygenase B-like [Chanos chanos]|uniref:Arachidonate 15-lipoxygenase B-like n=1 Tax=Chanos chanos TaxID=29144 RepID=A0A6J2WLE4_CHACN|nr:arachidonate 15-lipoxygenase B-like [Chanos chanos]
MSYQVEVFTGDMLHAGTTSRISIKLVGTKGSSKSVNLSWLGGFWRGSVRKFELNFPASIGSLLLMELEAESLFDFGDNEWFCSKVTVTTPEGDKVLFPCYRWLADDEKLVFRDAVAKTILKDPNDITKEHRNTEIRKRSAVFRWQLHAPGIPHKVKADSPEALPDEVRFSFGKKTEFRLTQVSAILELRLQSLADRKEPWTNFEQLDHVFAERRTDTFEYVRQHWREDEFFGSQLLNGINPILIQKCSELPRKFPVTDDMVKAFLPSGSSLKNEMKRGNIFLCDYKRLDGLSGNVINKKQQYLSAPMCLLFSNPEGKLLPIAIQLKQEPGEENPIFLPSDSESDWLLAKIFVRSAEFNEHELNSHLLRTHLMAEVFTVATLRNLPAVHPLFKLLIPHCRYTLQINIMARSLLISDSGVFAEHTAIGRVGTAKFLKRATSSLTYSSLCLPDDIKARGVEDIPNYYYRDDGLKLWNIINKYVDGVVRYYYTSDDDVIKDTELQSWIGEIYMKGFLEKAEQGITSSFKSVDELIKFVTMAIFTASAQHAAVNNGQFDYGGWMPNLPSTLKCPPPTKKGSSTEDSILDSLPDISTTVNIMAALYVLSKASTDRYPLGYFPEELFNEVVPLKMIEEFQVALKSLSEEIERRNQTLPLPYVYLNPTDVDNSIAI